MESLQRQAASADGFVTRETEAKREPILSNGRDPQKQLYPPQHQGGVEREEGR